MINWKKSANLNEMDINKLKSRFDKYPKSNKRIIAICDNCGEERELYFYAYRDLCNKCSVNTSESRTDNSKRGIKRWANPTERAAQAERLRQYYINNPEAKENVRLKANERWFDPENRSEMSEIMKQYYNGNPESLAKLSKSAIKRWSNQDNRDKHSERRLNSIAAKAVYEMMRGGNDIVKHHFIYDHNNPNQHTVEITRAEHTSHHMWMKRNGLEVPHYNVTEENKNVFGRR